MDLRHQKPLLIFLLAIIIELPHIQSLSLDPCDLQNSFMYCVCNIFDQPEESEIIVCNVFMKSMPNDTVWASIQKLSSAVTFKLQMRQERLLDYFVPTAIFNKMKKLQYFYTKGGNIGTVPTFAFANSSSIDQIVLENNNISKLDPFAFANLHNLTTLNLAENIIQEVSRDVFVNLPNLKQLDLKRNHLTLIHDRAFQDLHGLEELQLQKNNLTILTRETFTGIGSVRILDLSDNLIELLGENVFSEMKSLIDIDLTGNHIAYVSPVAFDGLVKVGRLNLKNNKLIQMSSATFEPLFNLHFLDVRHNLLEELDIGPLFDNFLKNGQLMVEENRFKCQCQLAWVQNLLNKTEVELIKTHLKLVECEMPQKHARHLGTSTIGFENRNTMPSAGSQQENFSTIVATLPEQTTTYAIASVKRKVWTLQFTDDLSCNSASASRRNRISSSGGIVNPSALEYEGHSENQSDEGSHVRKYPNNESDDKNGQHHHHQVADQSSSAVLTRTASLFHRFSFIPLIIATAMTTGFAFCLHTSL